MGGRWPVESSAGIEVLIFLWPGGFLAGFFINWNNSIWYLQGEAGGGEKILAAREVLSMTGEEKGEAIFYSRMTTAIAKSLRWVRER